MSHQNEKSCHNENFRILIENWIDFTSSGTEFRLGIRYVNGGRNINPVKLIPISCEKPLHYRGISQQETYRTMHICDLRITVF